MAAAIAYAREHRVRFLDDLREFPRIPSVSTAPERAGDVARAAQWLSSHVQALGVAARIEPTDRHPIVRAEWLKAPGAPTVLCYGHFDVQPPEPLELWRHPPFEPTVEDGVLYARGASDDKGQLLTHVKAVESILKSGGELPVNVKFIFEGIFTQFSRFVRRNAPPGVRVEVRRLAATPPVIVSPDAPPVRAAARALEVRPLQLPQRH